MTQVEFRVDGTLVGTDSTAPYNATWDASAASIGFHTVAATAYDAAGNAASASVIVEVPPPSDTAPPTVSVTSPANGPPCPALLLSQRPHLTTSG